LFEAEGGIDAVLERHARLAQLVRHGVRQLGLRTMAEPPFESDSVTVAILPAGISASSIRKSMARETGIEIAGAQGDYWKPRMIRIGTLGFVTHSDVVRCLRALDAALADAGHSGERASSDVYLRSTLATEPPT
jgi:alanine-glyoxylate transaminase/serine-glyoxylate transaminase/serine-pyruvate transaminase